MIEAASRLIAREGVAAATTRKVAQEAGLPAGSLHYWFAGMDDLLEEVVAAVVDELRQGAEAGAGSGQLVDRLRGAFRAVREDDPGRQLAIYEMTAWALRKPRLAHIAQHQYAEYHRLAIKQLAAWTDETGAQLPVDPAVAGTFITALFDGLTLSWLANPEDTDVDAVLTFASVLLEQHASIATQA